MPITRAHDFLTRSFGDHQKKQLNEALTDVGTKISRREGEKLGVDADSFKFFYENKRAPGRSVGADRFQQFATTRYTAQMKALETGVGTTGFALADDLHDNWVGFIEKANLFSYAGLAPQHRQAILRRENFNIRDIQEVPSPDSIERARIEDPAQLPSSVQAFIRNHESKHYR